MNYADALSGSRCFRGLQKEQLRDFLQTMELRPFQRNQMLTQEDEGSRVVFVISGRVKLVRHRPSGKDLILNLFSPGKLVELAPDAGSGSSQVSLVGVAQGALATMERAGSERPRRGSTPCRSYDGDHVHGSDCEE